MDPVGEPSSELQAPARISLEELNGRDSDSMSRILTEALSELIRNSQTVQARVFCVPPPAFNLKAAHAGIEHRGRATRDIENAQAFEETRAFRDDSAISFGKGPFIKHKRFDSEPFIEHKVSGESGLNIAATFMDDIGSQNSPVSVVTRVPVWHFASIDATNHEATTTQLAPAIDIQPNPGKSSNGPSAVTQPVHGPFFYAAADAPVQAPLPARNRPAALARPQTSRPQTPEMPKRSLSEIYLMVEEERVLKYNSRIRRLARSEYVEWLCSDL